MPIEEYYAEEHERAVRASVADGVPRLVFDLLDTLTNEQRRDAFHTYCAWCGSADTRCVCMKDC